MVLERIQKANDIKRIDPEDLDLLADEIREFLIEKISRTGGHLASNLGVVELTMALHLAFRLPKDKMIWDVGHQSYTHKILTGRKAGFDELRTYGGMSGFPKRKESSCDAFDTGHSSTSISAGIGYVKARELLGQKHSVISIIGDGSLTGGMAYEALNNASQLKSNFIIVLNDNRMSISENVGGMSRYLNSLRTAGAYTEMKRQLEQAIQKIPGAGERVMNQLRRTKSSIKQLLVPGMFFEDMGITYLGPVDGHDIKELCRVFHEAKKINHAVLVHVITKKGMGYLPAEEHPETFHGTGPFEIVSGKPLAKKKKDSYTDVFSKTICELGKEKKNLAVITAAMEDGTGLSAFRKAFPDRFFDVGIAEQHAVTFAAGLAAGGIHPVFAVYSSFLQRGYDQIIHDVCLQNLPVTFAIDRAGLVGSDGETHQGVFDLSYLSHIPNMTVMAPKNGMELEQMIRYAADYPGPVAVRYPRGEIYEGYAEYNEPIIYGRSELITEEKGIAVIAVGHMFETAAQVRKQLKGMRYDCTLVNARFVKPMDTDMLRHLAESHRLIAVIEENVRIGGFGEQVQSFFQEENLKAEVHAFAIPDEYVEHGNVSVLRQEVGLCVDAIVEQIVEEDRKQRERS